MSSIRSVVTDTWKGLVQRRLWPVALVLLAGMASIPLLLAAESETEMPTTAREQVAAESTQLASEPIVAAASAADRDRVRRVLGKRKDPFKPTNQPRRRKSEEVAADARSTGDGADRSVSGAVNPAPVMPSGGGGASPGPVPAPTIRSEPSVPAQPKPTYADRSITVRWGSSDEEELERFNVKRLGALPSADEPVVIYLGLTDRGRTAVFMVDAAVTVDGDGRCRPDPSNCETIELAKGETQFFEVEGENGTVEQYQLDLVRIHRTTTRTASSAGTRRPGAGRIARAARRSLDDGQLGLRYDEKTGLLERVDDPA
jgi:hypothetical protein